MECSRLGSSIHGISQARILEWVAVFLSRGSSQPWDWTRVYGIAGKFFFIWATREALDSILKSIDITLPKVHRVKTMPFFFFFSNHVWMEKEMATHSCSCLENPRGRGAWWAAVYGVAQSRTQLTRLSSSCSSINHVWIWKLNHKEEWAPKNWHFKTVVLEKTPDSLWRAKRLN